MSPTSSSKGRSEEKRLRSIDIYRPEQTKVRGLEKAVSYISGLFPTVKMNTRPSPNSMIADDESSAELFARARMKNPDSAVQDFEPMYGEIEYERRLLEGEVRPGGVVYDGRAVQDIFHSLNKDIERISIVITDRMLSTFSRDDLRHHLRTAVFGFPTLVSLPGIVEAPAMPRQYYLMKQRMELEGCGEVDLLRMKGSFKGRFMEEGDPRTPEVLKGLLLQCVVYHLTLNPFCDDKSCRLFNAHWQEDLVKSQVDSGKLCLKHMKMISDLGKKPIVRW